MIGDAAKNQVAMNPHNTVFDAKRLIGRKFADPEVQSDLKHFPFKVFDKASKPYIRVNYRGEDKEFVSSLISTFVQKRNSLTPLSSLPKKSHPWSFLR